MPIGNKKEFFNMILLYMYMYLILVSLSYMLPQLTATAGNKNNLKIKNRKKNCQTKLGKKNGIFFVDINLQ